MKYKYGKSLAGHDKDRIYEIIKEDGPFLFLKDDKGRTKKKNRKHIQLIKGETHV